MQLPSSFLDAIRTRVPIAGKIARYTKLTKKPQGRFVALCCFHREKTPSLWVYPEHFHCHGCGAHGDVISVVMQKEGLGFVEAVEALAHEAGLEVPKPDAKTSEKSAKLETLHAVLEEATRFFEATLASNEGRGARAYLEGRGISPVEQAAWRLGYAPLGSRLTASLVSKTGLALILEAGLARQDEYGEARDFFRDRIIFPIADRNGRVVGFGGRGHAIQPKYINTPETPLFAKGRMLYGEDKARRLPAEQPVIAVEGYTDAILATAAGYRAVAPLGTALTEEQLVALWRLHPEPVLMLDADEAGRKSVKRAIVRALPLLVPGRTLHVASLADGLDPADALASGGDAFKLALDGAAPIAETLVQIETARYGLDGPDKRASLQAALITHADTIADRTVASHYRRYFRERVWSAIRGEDGRWKLPVAPLTPTIDNSVRRRREEALLALVLTHPWVAADHIEEFADLDLRSPDLALLRRTAVEALSRADDPQWVQDRVTAAGFGDIIATLGVTSSTLGIDNAAFRAEAENAAIEQGWLDLVAALGELDGGEQQLPVVNEWQRVVAYYKLDI